MARVRRQGLRCRALRSDRQPCGGFAMVGQSTCSVHGGRSPRARAAAHHRVVEAQLRRGFQVSYERWQAEWRAWQAHRIAVTSGLLGIPPHKVHHVDMAVCRAEHGVPAHPDEAPVLRWDRRYGPRR